MRANDLSAEEAAASNTSNSLIAQTLLALDKATPNDENIDYKRLYLFLFNGISDSINALKQLQCEAEELLLKGNLTLDGKADRRRG